MSENSLTTRKWLTCGVIFLFVACLGIIISIGGFTILMTWVGLGTTSTTSIIEVEETSIPVVVSPTNTTEPTQVTIPFKSVVQILAIVDGKGHPEIGWTGSGSIISPDGYILTNAHVVLSDQYFIVDKLIVSLTVEDDLPPKDMYYAEVLQADEKLDIAVIRVISDLDGNFVDYATLDLPFVQIGNADELQLGDVLTILGYPGIGGETITLTRGEVSGFTSEQNNGNRAFIKTSGTIAGGNSGGLVADADGYLIGIPTQLGYGGDDQFVDCRVLADTNRDGVVNEDDSCIPTGGFINALRPINLAIPLINAAKEGEVAIIVQEEISDDIIMPESGKILFSDDFSNSESGWGNWDSENGSAGYVNNSYAVEVKQDNYYAWGTADLNLKNVIISIDTHLVNPVGDGGYGLVCRYQDGDNFYGFEITEDGFFAIWKYQAGEYEFLVKWTRSSKLNNKDKDYKITVVCNNDDLVLSVDGEILTSVKDTSFQAGNVGLIAGTFENSGFIVSFDNYVVIAPEE